MIRLSTLILLTLISCNSNNKSIDQKDKQETTTAVEKEQKSNNSSEVASIQEIQKSEESNLFEGNYYYVSPWLEKSFENFFNSSDGDGFFAFHFLPNEEVDVLIYMGEWQKYRGTYTFVNDEITIKSDGLKLLIGNYRSITCKYEKVGKENFLLYWVSFETKNEKLKLKKFIPTN